jgi:hypothetical protein
MNFSPRRINPTLLERQFYLSPIDEFSKKILTLAGTKERVATLGAWLKGAQNEEKSYLMLN